MCLRLCLHYTCTLSSKLKYLSGYMFHTYLFYASKAFACEGECVNFLLLFFHVCIWQNKMCVCVYSRWMYQYEGTVCEKWSQKTGSNVFFWRLCLYEPEWILYKGKGFADKRNVILWSIWQWDKYTRYVKSKVWSLFITTF